MMDFQTKETVCKWMVDLLPSSIHTVLEPTPGEGNLVRELQKRNYSVTAPEEFWDIQASNKYDAVVMNPPFTPMEQGYKILYRVMDMTNNIIALMPWLTIINSEKRTSDIRGYGLISISHLPRSVFKGARVQTCVLQMQYGYTGVTSIHFPNV